MLNVHRSSFNFLFFLLFVSCGKTIQLDLPTHKSNLVIEFYLENGKSLRCTLQESISFTGAPANPLVSGALVVLSYNNTHDTLKNVLSIDTMTNKIYNYVLPKTLIAQENTEYNLYVRDTRGRTLTGKTRFIKPVPISKHDYVFNSKDSVSVGVFFQDEPNKPNYYRALAYQQTKKDYGKIKINGRADIELPDITFEGKEFGFYTDYIFGKNDTIAMRLYNLLPDHFEYMESVEDAIRANLNPFAQPAVIRSNVQGGLGIFTTLNYEEKQGIILK